MNEWFAFSFIPLHALRENSILFCYYSLFTMSDQFDDVIGCSCGAACVLLEHLSRRSWYISQAKKPRFLLSSGDKGNGQRRTG
jgi:hypothetical protein